MAIRATKWAKVQGVLQSGRWSDCELDAKIPRRFVGASAISDDMPRFAGETSTNLKSEF